MLNNLLLFLDKVLHSVNEGYSIDVVFLDLAKAFGNSAAPQNTYWI